VAVTTPDAFHESMGHVELALAAAGVDPVTSKTLFTKLEEGIAPQFGAGQTVEFSERAVYWFVKGESDAGLDLETIESDLRRVFRDGELQ